MQSELLVSQCGGTFKDVNEHVGQDSDGQGGWKHCQAEECIGDLNDEKKDDKVITCEPMNAKEEEENISKVKRDKVHVRYNGSPHP